MEQVDVAIIGAGISGLAAAVALHQQGQRVVVYEQATALVEIGAGLSVFANGLRVLDLLGLSEQIEPVAAEPDELVFRHWRTSERVGSEALGHDGRYRSDFGFPYLGVLRSHVQRALVGALPSEAIRLDHQLVGLDEEDARVQLRWSDGSTSEAGVVIAADGARSTVRELMVGNAVVYSGTSGFRGIVEAAAVPSLVDPESLQFWVGPDAHLLHFPIDPDARLVTFLAVTESPANWPDSGSWRIPCTQEEALEPFAQWHPAVREMIGAVQHRERWGLFSVSPLERWSFGRVVLLGDAAHGMLPHYGQGANQGIEDAFVLAALLSSEQGQSDPCAAIETYERVRKPHTARVQAASWNANKLLHVADLDAASRNQKLTEIPDFVRWMHMHDAGTLVNELQDGAV
jgi:salicylate hydroxylase